MKSSRSLISTLGLVVLSLTLNTAWATTETVTESYPIAADGRLSLENVNGTVDVVAWDRDDIKMEAVKEAKSAGIVADIKINVESTKDKLSIKTELPRVKRGWFRRESTGGKVNYTLHVPAGLCLDKISSVNGNVSITGVAGPARVSSVNGSIRCRNLAGAADLSTVNGSIDSTHRQIHAGERVKASSVNGGIDLGLPADLSADLSASSVNGSIRSDFEATTNGKSGRHSIHARIGDGGSQVNLSTVNGAIRIRKSMGEQASTR